MRSMASYLLLIFMIMFWIFRIIVAFTASIGIDIGVVPINMNIEIVLLFITILCILLISKRKLLGAIIYLISYGMYFGVDLYNIVLNLIDGSNAITDYSRVLVSFIGIVIPISVMFSLLMDKNRTAHPVDKKTDWFYKNEEYDRKLDERADKNNYRNY